MARNKPASAGRYANRAHYWRGQLASAATPAEQFMHAQRWLHALARQAEQSGRRKDASGQAFSDAAEDAFTEAAAALAEICRNFERQICPVRDVWLS